ncbi:hypothetical protein EIK77_010395 [Talaromyces pinophilus]|nr:hypothetical protein EIK77_010395 [Talaromyces pinophilus]
MRRLPFADFAESGTLGDFIIGDLAIEEVLGENVADLRSELENEVVVAVVGCDIDPVIGYFSEGYFEKLTPGLTGLNTGVRAFKNSVYASGGVIGVEAASSCLILLIADSGPLRISDGKVQLFGVCKGGSTGLAAGAMVQMGSEEIHQDVGERAK